MLKQHKWTLLISSFVTLLPMAVGFALWALLPDRMATHWGLHGQADGYSGKLFAIVAMPLIMLALQWFCIFFTLKDKNNKGQNKKVLKMVLWIIPFGSLFASGIIYTAAFGRTFDTMMFSCILMGAMFIFIGNYLPKCKQNRTIGIKIKWTFESEENWNATHRFGGKVWVIGGAAILLSAFLPERILPWVMLILLAVLVLLPVVYSYRFSRKHPDKKTNIVPLSKKAIWISAVLLTLTVVFVVIVLFTGSIRYEHKGHKFYINASYWSDSYLYYGDVEEIRLLEQCDPGVRTNGFGSLKLSMGHFRNDEFGHYYRYTYNGCESCIVIVTEDCGTFVINDESEQRTKELYDFLVAQCQ